MIGLISRFSEAVVGWSVHPSMGDVCENSFGRLSRSGRKMSNGQRARGFGVDWDGGREFT